MSEWTAEPGFGGMKPVYGRDPGVRVRVVQITMASVLARKDKTPALLERAKAVFGFVLSDAPMRSGGGEVAALGLGPGRWMFLGATLEALQAAFAGLASLSDQGAGYAVFEIGGPQARLALAKGMPLDLDLFKEGDAAVTSIAHIGAIIWKNDAERWVIAVFRSYAASFWHWLEASAGEFGLMVEENV